MKKIAVILSGCGYLDGAEIRESVLTLLALDQAGVSYKIFALNQDQHHVVNHLTGEEMTGERRNILEEAARIARGKIEDVAKLDVNNFDALVIPGGFGVAKNLCTFAFEGSNASVNPQILGQIKAFKAASKPIGAICIAPALLALALGSNKPVLTLGTSDDVAREIEKTGAIHQNCTTSECIIDREHKFVSTPAYMGEDAKLSEVYLGISTLVQKVIELA
ncbi:isoprenoid biosynthesis glyoxalase ElbB [Serratia fonticola]|uniref:isoprenoid biosynthesis glyoxalase ElbB n=1 Tax=Serratia fonticola TaxID=47917 RepID=UPI00217C5B9C|nr:isoprenoid biosynthesis glyoxalase ElbB [Serratia fonticola]CAI1858366.1 Sigma cross-reacting protein 27A [Serratia fonticola]CAI1883070.1 Sigma cross-reacting protein 27A [Serratia fonticola]CAI1935400.1 Sigma cross-reacting protein 27A [Serratia fonticola]